MNTFGNLLYMIISLMIITVGLGIAMGGLRGAKKVLQFFISMFTCTLAIIFRVIGKTFLFLEKLVLGK